ncbi:hypothetical protein BMS3Abin10_01849 [bacterium BMS3Abin10]|nr:hypothetical protein BMS3Abin10_01849 [bacterium BMS3Abin10]GBE40035.1 hypothetical protein BMS3Bbin08_02671 [bacterium BMS3Bbin08]HDH51366.1 hypothetical protein [Nitrospirota bacterium]
MEIFSYITVNLLLFSSWYIFLFKYKNSLSFADRVLGTFVLGLAQIILTQMVLGILFKKLFATPLFALNITVSLVILIFIFLRKPGFPTGILSELYEKLKWFLNTIKSDWILLSVFTLFFISLCYLLFTGYLFPSYSWDSQFYHLPIIGFILQSGAIENIPYNSLIYTFINVFPKNIDLFFLWNVIFLKSGTIVDLGQLPFTIAGMLAVYSMAVKLKIRDKYAVYCALLFFFAPVVILQSTTNYVDIAVSVLFLMAANFLLCPCVLLLQESSGSALPFKSTCEVEPVPPRRWIGLLLAGVTAGILLGAKGSGPLFVFALSIIFIINEFRIRHDLKHEGFPTEIRQKYAFKKITLRYAVYFMAPVILLGSYWYIQNWLYYGNPVYPFQVFLFGKILFPGPFTEVMRTGPEFLQEMSPVIRPFYVWLEKAEYYFYASELSGFGPLWFILFLPATAFAVVHKAVKRKYDFLVLFAVILFVYLVHPNNWNTRYVIFIFGLGCLSFGVLADYVEKRGRILQFIGLFFAAYTFFAVVSPSVTPEKIKEFIHLPANARTIARMEPYILNESQRDNYGLWEWISRNVKAGETLAYTFHPNLLGPFWNSDFSNKIVYVKESKFEKWVNTLDEINADYVLVLVRPRSMEYFWFSKLSKLRNDPKWTPVYNKFRPVYSDSDYVVMRIIR